MNRRKDVLTVRVTRRLLDAFEANAIFFAKSGRLRLREGDLLHAHIEGELERHVRFSVGSNLFSMGAFSYSRSELPTGTRVGRYCSVGPGVEVLGRNHPVDRLSTSPFTYNSEIFGSILSEIPEVRFKPARRPPSKPMPVIGNDVWIGEGVTLARGVVIGDGAVLAARSLVTKDVPPFEIWGGVPARSLKGRFQEPITQRLVALQWWRYCFASFPSECARGPIEKTLDLLETMIGSGQLAPYQPPKIRVASFLAEHA